MPCDSLRNTRGRKRCYKLKITKQVKYDERSKQASHRYNLRSLKKIEQKLLSDIPEEYIPEQQEVPKVNSLLHHDLGVSSNAPNVDLINDVIQHKSMVSIEETEACTNIRRLEQRLMLCDELIEDVISHTKNVVEVTVESNSTPQCWSRV